MTDVPEEKPIIVRPNSNFESMNGSCAPDEVSAEYREYRRMWMENPRDFILRDFPIHLDIESTSRCNLRCTFCDKLPLLDEKGKLGDLDFDLYRGILDQGAEQKLCSLKLSYRGEPLLHRHITDMVSYAKARGVLDVYFNTNGMLLTLNMSERLIDAGLDRISISIEGTDPEAFERERRGARFHVIRDNIIALRAERERQGAKHPKIRIQSVRLPGLDTEEYQKYWRKLADEVALIDYKDVTERDRGIARPWACPQLWQRMTIEWDGTVLPCNNDDLRLLSPGNARDRDIRDCWHDARVIQARRLHQQGASHQVAACDGCPWRTTQIEKLDRQNEV